MTEDQYLTPAQIAAELQVTTITVRRWITTGQLTAAKAGPRRWMIRRSDVDRFLAGTRKDPAAVVASSEDPSFSKQLVAPGEH